MHSILALDLGTETGWAYDTGVQVHVGHWSFKQKRGDGAGVRFLRLRAKLQACHALLCIGHVVYELPQRFKSAAADDVCRGMMATLQTWCEENGIPYEGINPLDVKQFALGKRGGKGTGKDAMLAAARARWYSIETHDEADARWMLQMFIDGAI